MSRHTPGPWEADVKKYPVVIRSKSVKQRCIADGGFEFLEDTGSFIANAMDSEADARLIAAAPKLLEACELFLEWLRRESDTHNRDTPEGRAAWREWFYGNIAICGLAQEKARAAIARATGNAPGETTLVNVEEPDLLWHADHADEPAAEHADDLAERFADGMENDTSWTFRVLCYRQMPDRRMKITLSGGDDRIMRWEWVPMIEGADHD